MTGKAAGHSYRAFSPRGLAGGERVTVFPEAGGDLLTRARGAGTSLSVFIEACEGGLARLRVFSPQGEEGKSDLASLAALHFLTRRGLLTDWATVRSGTDDREGTPDQEGTPAQFCGGEWLLSQGQPRARTAELPSAALELLREWSEPLAVQVAQTEQPNLLVQVRDLAALQALRPGAGVVAELGRLTGTTGLVLYALAAPEWPALRRADVSFRAFGPRRCFAEEVASSDRCACLVAGLGERDLWPPESGVLRAAQLAPGQPALLTAQFSGVGETVWVGGRVEEDRAEEDSGDAAGT